MKKKNLKIALASRWAIREDEAVDLASSDFGENWFKDDGEVDHKNLVTRRPDGIAVVHIDGALSYRSDLWKAYFGMDTYNSIESAIDDCVNDPSVLGIVFDINSPGGEVSGCADLADKIFELRSDKAHLPLGVNSRTGGLMCSASYWIGSSCEHVFTATNGTLGSIGVLCAYAKNGKDLNVIVSDLSPNKNANPETEDGLKLVKQELNDLAEVFISAVARNRGTTFDDVVANYGKGGVFIGQKAVDAGLADGVATIDEICEMMMTGKFETNTKGADEMTAKKTESGIVAEETNVPTAEEIGRNAIAKYKQDIADVKALFDSCGMNDDAVAFVDSGKTLADAKEYAFDAMREMIVGKDSEISGLKSELESVKAELEKRPDENANLTPAQVEAIRKGIEQDAGVANGVQGGAQENPTAEQNERKRIDSAFAKGFRK